MTLEIEFLYILAFSIVGGVLATRFKQPTVLGVLLAGALIGPNAFGLIHNEQLLEISIEIGAILLLFLVGIEFSIEKLISLGIRSIIVATVKLGMVFLAGYYIATLFGYTGIAALAIGVVLAITSTVIFLKILEQKGLHKREEVALLIAVLIIEDIFGVFALTFFSSLGNEAGITAATIVTNVVISLAVICVVYMVLVKALKPVINWLSHYSTEEIITFIAIGLCAGMSFLAHEIGLSTAVGAFLAGNIVSSLKKAEAFEKAAQPFILTFTAFFFFSIGTIVDFQAIQAALWLVLALFVVNVLAKFFAISFATYFTSRISGQGAVFSGIAMVSLGEFSLLIAKEAQDLSLGIDLVSITAFIIFFSSITMSMLITNCDRVHQTVAWFVPRQMIARIRASHQYLGCFSPKVLFKGLRKRRITLEWHAVFNNILGVLFLAFVLAIWYQFTEFQYLQQAMTQAQYGLVIVIGIIILIFLYLLFRIAKSTRDLITDFFRSFVQLYPEELPNERRIFLNMILGVMLFIIALLVPGLIGLFSLDPRWAVLSPLALLLLIIPLITMAKVFGVIVRRNKKLVDRYTKVAEKDAAQA